MTNLKDRWSFNLAPTPISPVSQTSQRLPFYLNAGEWVSVRERKWMCFFLHSYSGVGNWISFIKVSVCMDLLCFSSPSVIILLFVSAFVSLSPFESCFFISHTQKCLTVQQLVQKYMYINIMYILCQIWFASSVMFNLLLGLSWLLISTLHLWLKTTVSLMLNM